MCDFTQLTPLLEAAKKFLITTPWETAEEGQGFGDKQLKRVQATAPASAESNASAVLCQLMEVRRLHRLLHVAKKRYEERHLEGAVSGRDFCSSAPSRASPLSALDKKTTPPAQGASDDNEASRTRKAKQQHRKRKSRSASREKRKTNEEAEPDEGTSLEAQILLCTFRHYHAALRSCRTSVQTLCGTRTKTKEKRKVQDVGMTGSDALTTTAAVDAAMANFTSPDGLSVVDVYFTLVLCISAALCWQHQQRQLPQQFAHRATTAAVNNRGSGDVVSSSRDTSAHSRRSSVSGAADTVYTLLRRHYSVAETVCGGQQQSGVRVGGAGEAGEVDAVLQRVLPLLEARLPMSDLWREPSLLAAFDVMACAVWQAQAAVHASTPSAVTSSLKSSNFASAMHRCPMCYAAALNSGLAVAAITQLNHYYTIYHGEGQDDEVGARQRADGARPHGPLQRGCGQQAEAQARGWVAACRTALWNHNGVALRCLTEARSPPWLPSCSSFPSSSSRNASLPPWPLQMSSASVPSSSEEPFMWTRWAACLVSTLWSHWWKAEMSLAKSTLIDHGAQPHRNSSQRLQSFRLFLNTVLQSCPAAGKFNAVSFGERGEEAHRAAAETESQRQAFLCWLMRLPLTQTGWERSEAGATLARTEGCVRGGDGGGGGADSGAALSVSTSAQTHVAVGSSTKPVTGTVLHWLCGQNEVVLLRLLLLHLCGEGKSALGASALALLGDLKEKKWKVSSALDGGSAAAPQHSPHVVQLTEPLSDVDTFEVNESLTGVTTGGALYKGRLGAPPALSQATTAGATAALHSQLTPQSSSLLRTLRLHDTNGFNALDVACQRGHLPCARLLLQCGLSPNSLRGEAWHTYGSALPLPFLRLLYDPSVLDGAASVAGIRDASHSTTTSGGGDGSGGVSGAAPRLGLADRLRSTACPAAAAKTLALLAHRLWQEKVQQLSCPLMKVDEAPPATSNSHREEDSQEPRTQEAREGKEGRVTAHAFEAWCAAYAQYQAAHDRVLRPAFAALAYDPHEPMARLVLLAVLTRKLANWLTVVPPSIRGGGRSAASASSSSSTSASASDHPAIPRGVLRELRLHHAVALRLYTQLTCPLGRSLLEAAVHVRALICAAVEMREERVTELLLASAQAAPLSEETLPAGECNPAAPSPSLPPAAATTSGAAEENTNAAQTSPQQREQPAPQSTTPASLPLSEAAKARRILESFHASVLADIHRLDVQLAAEQQRITACLQEEQQQQQQQQQGNYPAEQSEGASAAAATVLRGQHRRDNTSPCDDTRKCFPAAGTAATNFNAGRARNDLNNNKNNNRSDQDEQDDLSGDVPSYVLVVIPSALALRHARWGTKQQQQQQRTFASSPVVQVEPTLWSAASGPQQVWLRLPRLIPLDDLLRLHGGGAYGVVAHDMPLTAAVQRGDLVTFRYVQRPSRPERAMGHKVVDCGDAAGPPQFVAQSIFSEPRTLPYLAVSLPGVHAAYASPPASLVLPFAAALGQGTSETPSSSSPPFQSAPSSNPAVTEHPRLPPLSTAAETMRQLRRASTVTFHACCLPSAYVEPHRTTPQDTLQHPLDWLQAKPTKTMSAFSSGGILDVLRTDRRFVSRWAELVWAGVQPCWMAQTARAAEGVLARTSPSPAQQRSSSPLHSSSLCDGVTMVNLFNTDDEDASLVEEGRGETESCPQCFLHGVSSERVVFDVQLAAARSNSESASSNASPVSNLWEKWSSRADSAAALPMHDTVVGINL